MTYREAALKLLKEQGPMHYQDLADAITSAGLVQTNAATPAASLNATIAVDIKRKGKHSAFVRIRPGVFGLRGVHDPAAQTAEPTATSPTENAAVGEASDDADLRVRVPLFPVYSELRHLLAVWPGIPRKQVTGLRATINEQRGTPQKSVDWTDPATWIPERLKGDERELAEAIWERSKGGDSPPHLWPLAARAEVRPAARRRGRQPPAHERGPGLPRPSGWRDRIDHRRG